MTHSLRKIHFDTPAGLIPEVLLLWVWPCPVSDNWLSSWLWTSVFVVGGTSSSSGLSGAPSSAAVSTSASSSISWEPPRRGEPDTLLSFNLSFSEIGPPVLTPTTPPAGDLAPSHSSCRSSSPSHAPPPSPLSLLEPESQDRNSSSDGERSPSLISSPSLPSPLMLHSVRGSFSSSCSWSIRQRRNSWVSFRKVHCIQSGGRCRSAVSNTEFCRRGQQINVC